MPYGIFGVSPGTFIYSNKNSVYSNGTFVYSNGSSVYSNGNSVYSPESFVYLPEASVYSPENSVYSPESFGGVNGTCVKILLETVLKFHFITPKSPEGDFEITIVSKNFVKTFQNEGNLKSPSGDLGVIKRYLKNSNILLINYIININKLFQYEK